MRQKCEYEIKTRVPEWMRQGFEHLAESGTMNISSHARRAFEEYLRNHVRQDRLAALRDGPAAKPLPAAGKSGKPVSYFGSKRKKSRPGSDDPTPSSP